MLRSSHCGRVITLLVGIPLRPMMSRPQQLLSGNFAFISPGLVERVHYSYVFVMVPRPQVGHLVLPTTHSVTAD
ncbi:hypothetical protein BGZ63DRAFT_372140 [Mariannaea sp. PMI_226]|nr:hypothetical protein BGZ63DRAFT_372140 [Mariannaea sp. PMI_226]